MIDPLCHSRKMSKCSLQKFFVIHGRPLVKGYATRKRKREAATRSPLQQGRKWFRMRPEGVVSARRNALRGGEPLPTVSRYIRFY